MKKTGPFRDQVKRLSSTKIALEKSIVRLQEDRAGIERKLQETESVIRNRIDEIWRIKDSLENSFHSSQTTNANEVELPPIVVSSSMTAGDDGMAADGTAPGFNGNVVSINDENNFVIVDIGQEDGLRLGDTMNVYRGAEYIAALEVIQVRKDIAAADIKNKVAKIAVGDVVR